MQPLPPQPQDPLEVSADGGASGICTSPLSKLGELLGQSTGLYFNFSSEPGSSLEACLLLH